MNFTMEYKTLRSFFMRFNKEKLWKLYEDNEIGGDFTKSSCTKDSLCRLLSEHAMTGGFTLRYLERLDLLHYRYHANKKWIAYQMEGKDRLLVLNDPEEFGEMINEKMGNFLNCRVCVLAENNMLLTRISVWNGKVNCLLSSSSSIYLIHVPRSSYVFLSTVKASYKAYFLKALENLFGCNKLRELDLTGKKVNSLCDLVLHKNSQGYFSHFRLNQVDENPLSRKRKRDSVFSADDCECEKIINEEQSKDKKNSRQTLRTFGSNAQPSLEKVEFKMSTKFKAPIHVPELADNEETVNGMVRFKGTNVLEGLKKLSQYGMASHPLPLHIRNVHSLSRNCFILTDKKRTKESR